MSRTTKGILLMVLAVLTLAVQDAFSRLLAGRYNTLMVVMIRYWIFAAFLLLAAARKPEGWRRATRSRHLGLHVLRGILLITDVCLIVWSFTEIGLINSQAIFAVCPLLVVALSGPMLGERISAFRWGAVGVGCLGVLIILRPGGDLLHLASLLPLGAALTFAFYTVLTRMTARDEAPFPVLFWPAIVGAAVMTLIGLPQWQPVLGWDWALLLFYGVNSALGYTLLQRAYGMVEANVVQPLTYLHIVFVSAIGAAFFGEALLPNVLIGMAIVVAAGLAAVMVGRRATT